jgi:hypothetical protein
MGREGVAESVAGRGLDDARFPHCRMEGPLNPPLVEVVTAPFPGTRILGEAWRGEYRLPRLRSWGRPVRRRQRVAGS